MLRTEEHGEGAKRKLVYLLEILYVKVSAASFLQCANQLILSVVAGSFLRLRMMGREIHNPCIIY